MKKIVLLLLASAVCFGEGRKPPRTPEEAYQRALDDAAYMQLFGMMNQQVTQYNQNQMNAPLPPPPPLMPGYSYGNAAPAVPQPAPVNYMPPAPQVKDYMPIMGQ